jgi:hypothetical protein
VAGVWTAAAAECLAVELLAETGRLIMLSVAATAALTAAVLVTAGLVRLRTAAER